MKANKYKVAVWATGGVGSYAIRTIADRPNLDLVGVWVHSHAKGVAPEMIAQIAARNAPAG